jgi:Protein involved in cellulose biosynthesis (CelD)
MLRAPGVHGFIRRLLEVGVPAGWCRFSALRLAGESIAWHLGLFLDEELYWFIPVHRDKWASLGPGKLLLALSIERALERGWKRLHFLTGDHPYKRTWGATDRVQFRLAWHAPTLRGAALAAYDYWRRGATG